MRRNNASRLIAPVGILPHTVNHVFPEDGGVHNVSAPSGVLTDSAPKMASVLLQYASSTPCVMTVSLASNKIKQVTTMPLQVSITTRTLRLRMPRHVDRTDMTLSIESTGPAIVTGRVMFSYIGTYSQ